MTACVSAVTDLVLWHAYLWANFPVDMAMAQIKIIFQLLLRHQVANVC